MSAGPDWGASVLKPGSPSEVWEAIFEELRELVGAAADGFALDEALNAGDRLIADAAWDLWQAYPIDAPRVADLLISWWSSHAGPRGRAVLVLDCFSVREARVFLSEAAERGVPVRLRVRGACAPTDTQAFARALGLTQRSQLKATPPSTFVLAGPDLQARVADSVDFGSLAGQIGAERDIFLWCTWLDDLLVANHDKSDGPARLARTADKTLRGDAFWSLVDALRQGRDLVVLSDHGYAVSKHFVDLPKELAAEIKGPFGAQRCGPPLELRAADGRPLVFACGDRSALAGQLKWPAQGGFPFLGHGGLTLGEVALPFLEVASV